MTAGGSFKNYLAREEIVAGALESLRAEFKRDRLAYLAETFGAISDGNMEISSVDDSVHRLAHGLAAATLIEIFTRLTQDG